MITEYALLIKGFIVAGIIVALLLVVHFWKKSIISDTTNSVNTQWIKRETDANSAAQDVLSNKNQEIHKHQLELDSAINVISQKNQEIANAKKDYDLLHIKYASGIKRMSVRVSTSQVDTTKQDNHPAIAIGNDSEFRELMPEISGEILDFARGYSENLRMKNDCVRMYNLVRESIPKE